MVRLADLPNELLARIASYADQPTLLELRKTCRRLSQCSTPFLFQTLHIFPDEGSYRAVDGIMNDARLKKMVKHVYVNTCEDDYGSDEEDEVDFPEEFEAAIGQLAECQNVQSATLRFDKHCGVGRHHWMDEPPQTTSFRKEVLRVFFSWLSSLQVSPCALGIRNLQDLNVKDPEITSMIATVLRGLRSLRLSVVTEHCDASPEEDLEFDELHEFFSELPSTWLEPTTSSLEHLSLYCDNYFGFYPKLDLSGIHFPRLKTLALGNYGFVQDSQLDWILSHAATLAELYLDDCPILYDVCINTEHLAWCPFDRNEMETRDGRDSDRHYRSYDKRWHDYFDAFRTGLPLLRHFRMGSTTWMNGVPFEEEDDIHIGLLHDRYMACYDGYGPSPYNWVYYDEYARELPTCHDKDRDALRSLLKKIGQEVEENWSSGQHSVEDLLDVRLSQQQRIL